MSKRSPKNFKLNTTLLLFYIDSRKKMKARRGDEYHFVHKGDTFPKRNHEASCEKLWFVRSLYHNLPQMGQYFYPSMLMPFHDSMPRFMNFTRVLDLLELQKQVPQRLVESHGVVVFEIHPHFLHGT